MDPPGRASRGRDHGAAADRSREKSADGSQAPRQCHHHPAHPRLHPEKPRDQRCARSRARHPQPHRRPLENPPGHNRPLAPAAPAEHFADALGRSPGGRAALHLGAALDDIVEAMRRCLNPALSRSAIHRCLQRHGISARLTPDKAPAITFHTDTPAGLSISMSNTCRRSTASAVTPMSRSTAPPALSISRSCRSPSGYRRGLSAAVSRPLPTQSPYYPDRQRLRVHRSLRRRQKGQAARSIPRAITPLTAFAPGTRSLTDPPVSPANH